jgi:hypothetical protein
MPHFTGHVVFDPVVFVIRARKGRESSAVGTIALTVFPAVSISRFRLPGSVAEGDCQTRSALEGLTLHAAAARHARMRVAELAMSIRTTGAGIVQIKIANPSKRAAFRAIFNWTRQMAAVRKLREAGVRSVRGGTRVWLRNARFGSRPGV